MKVLLVDVPFGATDIGGQRQLFSGVENIIPSLGLAYLAAVAERDGHDVHILDCARGLPWEAISVEGRSFRPDVVGVSVTTPSFSNAVRTADILRRIIPGAAFVAGGSHPTAMPEETIESGRFDFLVLGEGETTFSALLAHLEGGGPQPESIPGLVFEAGGKPCWTGPAPFVKDLDTIPYPARHLLPPLEAYEPCPASLRRLPLAHVMTSRGCPSRCNFCDRAVFGERYRERSVENVMGEIELLAGKYGAREIRFFDDTFTLNRRRLERLCRELRRFRPRLPWTCLTRVNAVDLDMLSMMKDAGCWQVLFGLESGDDAILKTLNKGNTAAQNRRAVQWARQAGLRVRADFLVGSPAETRETLERTLAFARELDLDFAHFNKFVPFPGTTFYEELSARGYQFDFEQSSTLDHNALVYVPEGLSAEEYQAFLDRSYRAFYLRPRYLFRRAMGMRTWTEWKVHLRGARAMLAFG